MKQRIHPIYFCALLLSGIGALHAASINVTGPNAPNVYAPWDDARVKAFIKAHATEADMMAFSASVHGDQTTAPAETLAAAITPAPVTPSTLFSAPPVIPRPGRANPCPATFNMISYSAATGDAECDNKTMSPSATNPQYMVDTSMTMGPSGQALFDDAIPYGDGNLVSVADMPQTVYRVGPNGKPDSTPLAEYHNYFTDDSNFAQGFADMWTVIRWACSSGYQVTYPPKSVVEKMAAADKAPANGLQVQVNQTPLNDQGQVVNPSGAPDRCPELVPPQPN